LFDAAESNQDSLLLLDTGVTIFALANNPESAEFCFRGFVSPYLAHYSSDLMRRLLSAVESHRHFNASGDIRGDLILLEERAKVLLKDEYDRKRHPHLARGIEAEP